MWCPWSMPSAVQDLFPGLNERPPHAEILTQALDVALPAIDLPVAPKRAPLREEDGTVDALASPEGETADAGANSDEVMWGTDHIRQGYQDVWFSSSPCALPVCAVMETLNRCNCHCHCH